MSAWWRSISDNEPVGQVLSWQMRIVAGGVDPGPARTRGHKPEQPGVDVPATLRGDLGEAPGR